MKKIVFILLLVQSSFFYSQEEAPKPPKFDSSDRAGIIYYEVDEVTDNIKVKDEDLYSDVSKVIRKYNRKVKEVAFLNSKNFVELDVMINEALNSDRSIQPDLEEQKKKQEESKHLLTVIPDVRKQMKGFNIELNKGLEGVLSKKQYSKWLKYKKKKIKTLLPERPKAPDNGNQGGGSDFGNRNRNNQRRNGGGFR